MFRVVLPPIIRSAYNCIYSIWYLSHRYCYLPLSRKSWNWFECAVGGVRHPQHTQTTRTFNTVKYTAATDRRPSDYKNNSSRIFALCLPLHSPLPFSRLYQSAKGLLSQERYYVVKNANIILRRIAGRLEENTGKYAEETAVTSRLPCTK